MDNRWETKRTLLVEMLQISVPMKLEQWKINPFELEDFERRRTEVATIIASTGDAILFENSVKGSSARGFVTLTEAIAYLCAVVPDGITFCGHHFKYDFFHKP